MTISYTDENENLRRIIISGRLDIQGASDIDTKFAALTASADRRVVVDLSAVAFLASIGIRSIVSNAKAVQKRGGKMVLIVGDNVAVTKTLKSAGIDALIPIFSNSADANEAALG